MRIEDYALIGDLQTAALVGRNGSIDWLCLPRFDSASCFSALLGEPAHGRWLLAPAAEVRSVERRYRPGTLVLETDHETADGTVRVIDFMPRRRDGPPQVARIVEGLGGRVPMRSELALRPDYGAIVPWIEAVPDGVLATAGPDAFHLSTPHELNVADGVAAADFEAVAGSRAHFVMSWHRSSEPSPRVESADSALARTEAWWREWSGRCIYDGAYSDAVRTSLVVLKAMTHELTGALVAAPTTSLPEDIGGVRNWDYRYSWLRDSVLTLEALLAGGYTDEALAFRDFVLRAVSGDPGNVQIMYGVGGERRLTEFEVPHLPGYEGSKPVRIGNAASEQFQLDVYGEVVGVGYAVLEQTGQPIDPRYAPRWKALIDQVERIWREPDDGIWEARGPRRHYTHSKVMAWVAVDRAVRIAEKVGMGGNVGGWAAQRDEIHAEVCERAWDPDRRTFTQYYGSDELDAAVLQIPIVGFLPGDDERVTGTIDAVRAELGHDGFVSRYSTAKTDDGLPGDEGQFLACSFWLVSALALNGRRDEARALFERLLGLRQRPRAAGRGVRRPPRAPGGQLPAGVQPPRPDPGGEPPLTPRPRPGGLLSTGASAAPLRIALVRAARPGGRPRHRQHAGLRARAGGRADRALGRGDRGAHRGRRGGRRRGAPDARPHARDDHGDPPPARRCHPRGRGDPADAAPLRAPGAQGAEGPPAGDDLRALGAHQARAAGGARSRPRGRRPQGVADRGADGGRDRHRPARGRAGGPPDRGRRRRHHRGGRRRARGHRLVALDPRRRRRPRRGARPPWCGASTTS